MGTINFKKRRNILHHANHLTSAQQLTSEFGFSVYDILLPGILLRVYILMNWLFINVHCYTQFYLTSQLDCFKVSIVVFNVVSLYTSIYTIYIYIIWCLYFALNVFS